MRNCLARSSEPPAAEATVSCAPQSRCPKQTSKKNNIKQTRIFNSLLPGFVAAFYAPLPNSSNKRPNTYHFSSQLPLYRHFHCLKSIYQPKSGQSCPFEHNFILTQDFFPIYQNFLTQTAPYINLVRLLPVAGGKK
jgi:hypothetical protein